MIHCLKCQTPNPDGARFCKACRAPMSNTQEKKRCPNGHIMDPTWKICPICQGAAGSAQKAKVMNRQKTLVQPENAALRVSGGPRRKTKVEGHMPGAVSTGEKKARRKTVVISREGSDENKDSAARPHIVGFLVTYSHEPSGAYFVIREGRHIIGAGKKTDITIKGDKNISSEHSILLFRRGLFLIRDNLSTNGTFLNGEEISGDVQLNNYDKIKMGDTEFTLMMVHPSRNP
jgi:hypothetical protein